MTDLLEDPGLPLHDVDVGNVPSNFTNLADSFTKTAGSPNGNAGVVWGVNCFILFLIFLTVMWCCFVQRYIFNGTDPRLASDRSYRARLQRRREASKENPDKRQRKLHASFLRHKVQMTVKESDLIKNDEKESETEESNSATSMEGNDGQSQEQNDIETGGSNASFSSMDEELGQLRLGNGKLVPNCCAICLCDYQPGEIVTWSSNPRCIHAFHRECVTDWLIKMQPETPCPCCRQEFTDLEEIRKQHTIKWLPDFAFDLNALRFW